MTRVESMQQTGGDAARTAQQAEQAAKAAQDAAEAARAAARTAAQNGIRTNTRELRDRLREDIRQVVQDAREQQGFPVPPTPPTPPGDLTTSLGPEFSPEAIGYQVTRVMSIGGIILFSLLVGIPLARAIARWIDRRGVSPQVPREVTARLEAIEQAVESIAVEVERISEGQRFTTRLLSERTHEPVPDFVQGQRAGDAVLAATPAAAAPR